MLFSALARQSRSRLIQLLEEVRISAKTCVIPIALCESPLRLSVGDADDGGVSGAAGGGGVAADRASAAWGEAGAQEVASGEAGAQEVATRMRDGLAVAPDILNAVMRKHSGDTAVLFVVLPKPPASLVDANALHEQELLANPWMSPRSLKARSRGAAQPSPLSRGSAGAALSFLETVDLLTRDLPPTCLVRNGRRLQRLISTEL